MCQKFSNVYQSSAFNGGRMFVVVNHLDIYMQNNEVGWALPDIRYKKETKKKNLIQAGPCGL